MASSNRRNASQTNKKAPFAMKLPFLFALLFVSATAQCPLSNPSNVHRLQTGARRRHSAACQSFL